MEREVLKHMPPGTLDIITIQGRDVDGIAAFEVAEDPEKPGMVKVTSYRTPGTIVTEDLDAFTSAQL